MRVPLDASFARRGPSGTAVYVARLAAALRALGVDVVEAAPRARHRRRRGGPRSFWNAAAALAWIHVELPRRARATGADVLHHPLPALARSAPCPQVITVHDLAVERLPWAFDARYRLVARHRHRAAARGAAAVIVPSRATRMDVRSRWGVQAVLAPHGPGQAPAPARSGARHFLYVGDDEPRKNVAALLSGYASYRAGSAAPLPLVLAGAGAPHVAAPGVIVDRAPDLPLLLAHAAALVIPSLREGFGLPALEAMHAGTPVLAARTAGLAEVCADAARYVDPRDPGSIAAGLHELATVPPLREELRRRGRARAADFSWEASARAHLEAYTLALR